MEKKLYEFLVKVTKDNPSCPNRNTWVGEGNSPVYDGKYNYKTFRIPSHIREECSKEHSSYAKFCDLYYKCVLDTYKKHGVVNMETFKMHIGTQWMSKKNVSRF